MANMACSTVASSSTLTGRHDTDHSRATDKFPLQAGSNELNIQQPEAYPGYPCITQPGNLSMYIPDKSAGSPHELTHTETSENPSGTRGCPAKGVCIVKLCLAAALV